MTAPVSAGLVITRIASGSEVNICSGRVTRSKKRLTTRKVSVTDMSSEVRCSMSCSTLPPYLEA